MREIATRATSRRFTAPAVTDRDCAVVVSLFAVPGRRRGVHTRSVQGYVAVTDPGWWEQLSMEAGPKDANFWRPSTRPYLLPSGTPFFFKLKAPHDAIAGFGYFAGFSVLPDWLAWDTFGDANGVRDLAALRRRLSRIQEGARIARDAAGRIGCCLIAEATFFERSAWLSPPAGFSPRTQSGARIDLTAGEGLRVWRECLARTGTRAPAVDVVRDASLDRYGPPTLRAPRLGQAIFRVSVLDAYGRACAVTQEHSLPVLEAAHIKPYTDGGEHAISNGLALRSDLHRLFDRGYVTIDDDGAFVVGRRLKDDYENGRSYYGLHGAKLVVPDEPAWRPNRHAIGWHRENRFLG